ncbi:patatin-like phospholipase family protein [Paraburkholderia sp. J11-2]|uniref:patatin-like phospholipase family protein n=1 Tax=Paraburkholderia sp. J11-2 TaxID=2805431 RepID=UPI002AB793EA|nr:patatin-like phospholipase family protein [Paraburkholderia sp. J11-2]
MDNRTVEPPRVKGDFDAPHALASSLCGHVIPLLKVLLAKLTFEHTHRYCPEFYHAFSPTMHLEEGCVCIGRGYPLSSEDDVRELLEHCYGPWASEALPYAVVEWRERMSGKEPEGRIVSVNENIFDRFLRNQKLVEIEWMVRGWLHPQLDDDPVIEPTKLKPSELPDELTAYPGFMDELKVTVLYLAYRLGKPHHDALCRLVATLDWDYLARIIDDPEIVLHDEPVQAAAQRLKKILKGRAYNKVHQVLTGLPYIGHRALADEYAHIIGIPNDRKPSVFIQDTLLYHTDESGDGLSALCLSGGGIRSASFCLGVLQVLATYRLLGKFHYISTVSGGGYIGTALSRWIIAKTKDDDLQPRFALQFVEHELDRLRQADYVQLRMAGLTFNQEGPLTWLRMNSNYLARRLSLFSADAWTIVATYFRNLFIVWTMFWPWFMVFLLGPWFAVWLGQATQDPAKSPIPSSVGFVGACIGILGATYFFQGKPQRKPELRFANHIALPRSGDVRAAFGALLLVIACFCLSYAMWCAIDKKTTNPGQLWYVWYAIAGTQAILAWLNMNGRRSVWVMTVAAILAGGTQIGLLYSIFQALTDFSSTSNTSKLASAERALVTPALMLVALLIGEGLKAAVRSLTEGADRREHQGRAHAFVFMLLTAWVVSAALVIGIPALLSYYGGSAQGVAAAGSALSLAVSTFVGYRKTSPGKPGTQAPMSLTLIGSVGLVLLAVLLSIGTWKAIELMPEWTDLRHLRTYNVNWTPPVRYYCLEDTSTSCALTSAFQPLREGHSCTAASTQCIDQSFSGFVDQVFGHFTEKDRLAFCLFVMLCSGILFFALGLLVRMNEFSLHGFYRDRLIRTFYGGFRSVKRPRKPARFTGFDTGDDIPLADITSAYQIPSPRFDSEGNSNKPPFLVVNTALNLVKGDALAWQERKADSFTFTALHAGNYRLGYRRVASFADNVKLGTAMAISGAAFNPNMGYNSSTPMAFLMSVFNVRLGWWLGNPKFKQWQRKDPTSSSWRLLQEAAGQTTDTGDWVHLSDGGHFDNMGLWEMVHRRCRRIFVIDASQDGRFTMEDLYCAIRKIRIDMGIEISAESEPILLFPRSARAAGLYHARFTIRYLDAKGKPVNGVLLYLKPCVYGNEPPDIHEYAHKHVEFPHETTADQFFSESQFESYRKLGEWEMLQMLRRVMDVRNTDDIPPDVPMDTMPPAAPGGEERRGLFSPDNKRPR